MSFLSMVEAKLPPGFRFHPRDDELICDYLRPRAAGATSLAGIYGFPAIIDVDLNKCEPWDLPETACIRGNEWYFFSLKDKKYATGQRTNRATISGYWKATGKDRNVLRKGEFVGMRKTLVFYQGRAPKGKKTEWVMHEFRMETSSYIPKFSLKEDWVICRVFYKSRTLSKKIHNETCDEDTGSSSLPPLADSQILSYNQAPLNFEGIGQVPCFSNFSTSQAQITPMMGALPENSSSLNAMSYDKKVLMTILNQLTKVEDNQEFNESCSPSLWNPFATF